MLAFRPETVRMGEARDFVSAAVDMERDFTWLRVTQPIGFGWMANDLNEYGAMGDASIATAREGRGLRRLWRDRLHRTAARTSPPSIWRGSARGRSAEARGQGRITASSASLLRDGGAPGRRRRRGRPRSARRPGRGRRGDPRSRRSAGGVDDSKALAGAAARDAVRDHPDKGAERLDRLRQRRRDRRAQHSRRDAARRWRAPSTRCRCARPSR